MRVGQLSDYFVLGLFPKPQRILYDLPSVFAQCARPDFTGLFGQGLGHRVQFSQVESLQSPCRCPQRLFHSSGCHPGHPSSQACYPPFVAPDFAAETRDVPSVRRDLAVQTRDVPSVRPNLAAETRDVPFVGAYLPAHAAFLCAHLPSLLGARQHGQHQVAPVASFVVEGLGAAIDAPLVFQAVWAGSDRHSVKALSLRLKDQPTAAIHARDRRAVSGHHDVAARIHAERHPVYGYPYRRRLTGLHYADEAPRFALDLL